MSKEVNEERAPRTITDVKEMLSKHSNGEIQRTIQNCITILQNDHVLADAIRLNLLMVRPFLISHSLFIDIPTAVHYNNGGPFWPFACQKVSGRTCFFCRFWENERRRKKERS